MHTALVVIPHADDAAAFCGGTIAKRAAAGWRIVLVRVTDDAKDSVGIGSEAETIARNATELRAAADILGCAEIVELGFPTDSLADVSLLALRERFVYLLRKYRPYAVFSFDPFGRYEGNMDHIRAAQAMEEAYWVACFDLHHPEHFEEGLQPFAVCERWYFARQLPETTHVEDITEHLETKVRALAAHKTMMQNVIHQSLLQLSTWGRRVPLLEQAFHEDPEPLISLVLEEAARDAAKAGGLDADRLGEAFRMVRFGDLDPLFESLSEKIENAEEVNGSAPAPPPARNKALS